MQSHHRRSIRLPGTDYSVPGFYFITMCVQNRECLFGEIIDGEMRLNDIGKMIDVEWKKLHNRFHHITLDEYVIMPNHFHAIMNICPNVGAPLVGAPSTINTQNITNNANVWAGTRPAPTIGAMIGAFKSITTYEHTNGIKNHNWPRFNKKIWQRNYYEHIIRNDESLEKIRLYIKNNPAKWAEDHDNPINFLKQK